MPEGQPLSRTAALRLITLGGAALITPAGDDEPERTLLGPGKPLALLTYLALSPGRLVSREYLTDLLWADLMPERGRHALRQALWYVRQLLGEQSVIGKGDEIRLGAPIQSDRDDFLAAVEQRELERAVELYTGPFLPGFAAPGGAEFETWAEGERTRLRKVFMRAAETVVRRLLSISHTREAQQLARRVRDADSLDERGWRILIEALLSGHDLLSARLEAESLETLLQGEGRQPEPATAAVLRMARQEDKGPATEGAGLAADLIGREREFATILERWEAVQRGAPAHLHVVAAAGLGKSRLLSDIFARLHATGARAVLVRANPGDRQIAYASAAELVRVLGELPGAACVSPSSAGALLALAPALSGRMQAPVDPSTGEEALRRRTAALAELLAAVSEDRPLTVIFDDTHWLDGHSGRMLRAVFERLAEHRILVLTASRPAGSSMDSTGSVRIALHPFSTAQIGELLRSIGRLPETRWAGLLPALLETASGGSPLLVLEALQLALERGALVLSEDGWLSLDDGNSLERELEAGAALRRRVEQLPAEARRCLLALSVAGAPLEPAVLGEITGPGGTAIESTLQLLEHRGFAGRLDSSWQAAHDEIAARTLESANEADIAVMHGTLGRVLSRAGAGPRALQQAAYHLRAAGDRMGLQRAFARFHRELRRSGDWRRSHELAREFLGEEGEEQDAARLMRSLPLAARVRSSKLMTIAAVALVLALGTTAVLASRTSAQPAEDVLLVGTPAHVVWQVPVSLESWDRNRPILPTREGTQSRGPDLPFPNENAQVSPDGSQWAITNTSPDSGGQDVYLRRNDSPDRRLTFTPGDDGLASFSPDGRAIVFTTGRWNPSGWADLAVMDLETHRVRRLTAGDGYDTNPFWSPDGTRIAFSRSWLGTTESQPAEICWIAVEGGSPHCRPTGRSERPGLYGWLNSTQLLAGTRDSGAVSLRSYHIQDGRWEQILKEAPIVRLSHDGRWIACYCRLSPGSDFGAYVFPAARPAEARRILMDSLVPSAISLNWAGASQLPFLDSFAIQRPNGAIPADGRFQLRVEGFTRQGQPAALPVTTWRSLDTAVAAVDSGTGLLLPRGEGQVAIIASAGGWRVDTLSIRIGPPQSLVVFRENWKEGLDAHWRPFGDPMPGVTRFDDEWYFWNRGDSTFASGAYSRESWDAAKGLGFETSIRAFMTDIHWQYLDFSLAGAYDSTRLAHWDHRTGAAPSETDWELARTCAAGYPDGEGAGAQERFGGSGAGLQWSAPAPSGITAGKPVTIRIQIFPDRRCGVALNGKPVWMADAPLDLGHPYRIVIQGKSWHTRVLVGPVTVWTGVRHDVDWESLEDSTTAAP